MPWFSISTGSLSPTAAARRAPGLATPRLTRYLGNARHLAEFEDLLGRAGRKQMHAPGDDSGPAGLVASAAAAASVAVEVLVEGDEIAPVRIVVEQLVRTEDRSRAILIAQENVRQPPL